MIFITYNSYVNATLPNNNANNINKLHFEMAVKLNGTIQLLPEDKEEITDTSAWSDETKQEFYEFCMNKKGTGYYLDGAIEEFVAYDECLCSWGVERKLLILN